MPCYEISTSKYGGSGEVGCLRRAVDRLDLTEHYGVERVEIVVVDGCLQVLMTVGGRESRVAPEVERVFADAWYDAFGEREARHRSALTTVT